jgi:hypothetical protein
MPEIAVPPFVAVALFRFPPVIAVLLSPRAMATDPLLPESTDDVADPLCTRVAPPAETLMLGAPDDVDAFVVDGESVDEVSDDLSDGGLAVATHGDAAIATPMPSATANPPTRPIYREYPMIVLPELCPMSRSD